MGIGSKVLRVLGAATLMVVSCCSLFVSLDDLSVPVEADAARTPDAPALDADGGAEVDAPSSGDASTFPAIGCDRTQDDPSLLAYYAFDDGSGATVKDCSGRGHSGAIVGTPNWTSGKYGKALTFNGTDNCVDLGAAADLRLSTFTLAAWIYVTDYMSAGGLNGHILSKSSGNPNSIGWRFATTESPDAFELKLAVNGGSPFTLASPAFQPVGVWIHVGLVLVPGKRADIYLGGAKVKSNASPPGIYEETAASMRIGCNGGAKDYFKGSIDELRVYERVLTDDEMIALAR